MVFLSPSVKTTHHDNYRWSFYPRWQQKPAAECATAIGDLDLLDGWIVQGTGSRKGFDEPAVHAPFVLGLAWQRNLPETKTGRGVAIE